MSPRTSPVIVGIGSSAGGLEALEALFRAVPARTGLAFVVVSHLAPGRESALPVILGRFTPLSVVAVRDGEAVRPDHVYVSLPDTALTIHEGKLRVRRTDPAHHERSPIDLFLGSLADDQGERAIAVILSGTGSDGALGLAAVKERGGLAVAQGGGHAAPRHAGMPSSAIATGHVDLVLPAEAIPGKLVEYLQSFAPLEQLVAGDGRPAAENKTAAEAREAICAILRKQVGHDFAGYKERTFLRRVQRRMQVQQLADIDAYVDRLRQDPEEASLLFRDLLIGVTSFFRDPEAFEALERLVVPRLFEGRAAGDTVRVWVPGCATGEEAYSIAILLREHMDTLQAPPKVQVFASDIVASALKAARTARYPDALLAGMAPQRLKRFFTSEEDGASHLLSKQVRDMCIFSEHSLIRDPPFRSLDLVSCRNLLIYLGAELQARVLPLFHYALKPGGFLFLGSAENVGQHRDLFAPLDKKAHLFRRRDHAGAPAPFSLLVPGRRFPPFAPAPQRPVEAGPTLRREVETEVLERYAPAHVVVNKDGDVVHHSPRTGKYLEPPAGQPTRQVLAMARKGLRLDLRMALQEAAATRRAATRERVTVELEGGHLQLLDLTVAPLADRAGDDPLFLVLFADLGAPRPVGKAEAPQGLSADSAAVIERLERELRDTRERLQSTVEEHETAMEELKAANEELVSMNEELQSTNEELETGKEEIQSINEELQTVNAELGSKVEQLNQANADLKNLFDSTRIGIVFLDRELAIRNFTPATTELFNLLPSDRGRPLGDITGQLDHPGMHEDLGAVLASGKPVERQLSRRDGRAHCLMRVLPYHDDGAMNGVVVTFVDITRIVEAEQRQRTLIHELNHRVRNMLAVVAALAAQTAARAPSLAAFTDAFLGRIHALARAYGLLTREQWGEVTLEDTLREVLDPYLVDDGARITLKGPPAMLRSRAALALGMTIHELATNAVKHGALSVAGGQVVVEWDLEEREEGRRLVLSWRETGGPPVRQPATKGFGAELIKLQINHDLDGEVTTAFHEEGFAARMIVPWRPEPLE